MTCKHRMRQPGQAMAEFLLVSAAVAFALFYPYVQGRSVTALLMHALLDSLRAQSFLISIM